MARRPARTTSPEHAREIADRYFDLDHSADVEPDLAPHLASPPRPKHKPPIAKAKPKAEIRMQPQQARFVDEYLIDMNGTQAAIRAGYSDKTAASIAYENLRKPHIAKAIEQRLKHLAARADWDALRVLQRLGNALLADVADLFDEFGGLKRPEDWPEVWRQGLVSGMDVEHKSSIDEDGEIVPVTVTKLRFSDRTKFLELMGRHRAIQAWKDNVAVAPADPLANIRGATEGTNLRPQQQQIEQTRQIEGGANGK